MGNAGADRSRRRANGQVAAPPPAAGDPVLGFLVIDPRGRVVDGDPRSRQRLGRSPGLLRRLVRDLRRLAQDRGGWIDHVVEPGLHARALASSPDSELVVFLGAPAAPRRLDLEALSPRERQVASLLRAGRADPWIARRLRVSVATVRWHLTNVYRKAGLSGRAELRTAVLASRPRRGGGRAPLGARREAGRRVEAAARQRPRPRAAAAQGR